MLKKKLVLLLAFLSSIGHAGNYVTTPIGKFGDFARGLVIQHDGKIVLAGHSQLFPIVNGGSDTNGQFALVRYNPDFSLDTSFGSNANGIVTTSLNQFDDEAFALALQSDGKMLAAGF